MIRTTRCTVCGKEKEMHAMDDGKWWIGAVYGIDMFTSQALCFDCFKTAMQGISIELIRMQKHFFKGVSE